MVTIYYSQIPNLLKNTLIGTEKLNSRQLYSILVYRHLFTPTSQNYFIELFKTESFDWKLVYLLPCLITIDSYFRSFQYKMLNNVRYLNKERFHVPNMYLTSFSFLETFWWDIYFHDCDIIQKLWNELALFFKNYFILFDVTPQSALLGFLHINSKLLFLQNH